LCRYFQLSIHEPSYNAFNLATRGAISLVLATVEIYDCTFLSCSITSSSTAETAVGGAAYLIANMLTIESVCGTLCTATAGQFLEIEATSIANAQSHTVKLTSEMLCGGSNSRQRGGVRITYGKSVFADFNATACQTANDASSGAALMIDSGSFSAAFFSVANCVGDNIVLNYASATVTLEKSNFLSCTVQNAVLLSNAVGITATNCVFRGSATPFSHSWSSTYGVRASTRLSDVGSTVCLFGG
jgi:hypothetical protein